MVGCKGPWIIFLDAHGCSKLLATRGSPRGLLLPGCEVAATGVELIPVTLFFRLPLSFTGKPFMHESMKYSQQQEAVRFQSQEAGGWYHIFSIFPNSNTLLWVF